MCEICQIKIAGIGTLAPVYSVKLALSLEEKGRVLLLQSVNFDMLALGARLWIKQARKR